mgnify:CR=1 FL=1
MKGGTVGVEHVEGLLVGGSEGVLRIPHHQRQGGIGGDHPALGSGAAATEDVLEQGAVAFQAVRPLDVAGLDAFGAEITARQQVEVVPGGDCLLYTSDAADE